MQQINKEYEQAFVLEPTKLTRVIDKIHERLADHPDTAQRDHFEVFLTGNRREEVTTVDQVLALENSRKHRITRLVVVCSAFPVGGERVQHEVRVDFAQPKGTGRNVKTIVAIGVRSETNGWPGRALSEVEEQVERTWQHHLRPTLMLGILLVGIVILLGSQVIRFDQPRGRFAYQWMWLGRSDVDRIEEMMRQQRTLTEQELREVSTMQLRNLVEGWRPPPTQDRTRQLLLIGIPSVAVAICIILLLGMCYPKAVFHWGDEVDRYANVLNMRRVLWNVVIGVIIVGIASRLLYEGVTTWWLPSK